MTIRQKLRLAIGLIVIALIAVYTTASYLAERHLLIRAVDQNLLHAVQHARGGVPADYHDRIANRDSVSPEEFTRIVDANNKLCLDFGLQYLWSCMKVGDQIVFTTATSPSKDVRKRDHAAFFDVHKDPHAFDVAFETMKPTFSSFQNEWGHGRMVLVPDKDRLGRVYCFGASVSFDEVQAELRKTLLHSLYLGIGFLLVGMLVSLRVSNALAKPIVEFTKVADAIARGQMDQSIVVSGFAEIVSLGRSLTVMEKSIRQKIGELESEVIERKQAEAAAAKYQLIAEHARDPLLLMEIDGKLLEANRAAEALYGYSHEELLHLSISDLRLHADPEVVNRQKEQALTQGILFEAVHYRKDGSPVHVEVSSRGIIVDGKDTLLSVVRDITQRKIEEEALQKSEARMRHFFEHQTVGMAITSSDKKWLDVNDKLCQMLGYTREEMLQMTWEQLTHPDDRENNSTLFEQLLTGEIDNCNFEKQYICKDGGVIQVMVSLACVQQQDRRLDYILLLVVDITERKRAEVMLRASEARTVHFNGLLRTAYKVQRLIQVEQDEQKLLDAFCDIMIATHGYLGVWIGRPETESYQVISIASSGNVKRVLQEAPITWDDTPNGQGPCGTAIRERVPVVFNDITTEPKFAPWLKQTLAAGCASIASFPMLHGEQLYGVVTFKASQADVFNEEETELLSNLANEAAQAIENIKRRKELLKTEAALQLRINALEAAANAIVITDSKGVIEWFNTAFTTFTGYTTEEALGKSTNLLKSGKHDEAFYKNLWKTILAGKVWQGEMINRRKNGDLYPEEMTITPMKDSRGAITHFIAVKQDITKRKQAEKILSEAEEVARQKSALLKSIIESPQGIIIFSLDREYRYSEFTLSHQETIKKIWGVEIQLGMNMLDIISDPDDRKKAKHNFDRALQGESLLLVEEYGDRSLYRAFYENRYSPIVDAKGTILGITVFVIDVTERKRAEEALAQVHGNLENLVRERTAELSKEITQRKRAERQAIQQREQLQHLLDTAPVGVGISVDGIMRFANQRLTSLADLRIGTPSSTIYTNLEDRERMLQVLEREGIVRDLEFELRGPKGEARYTMATFLSTEFEEQKGILCWIVDIGKIKAAELAMRQAKELAESASRAKSAFLANMSHEIRTPMNAILGFSQLMLHDRDMAAQQKKHLETINRSGEHLLALINDVLDMAKIEAGRIELHPAPFDLSALLHDLEAMFRVRTDAKGLRLDIMKLNDTPQCLVADKNKLLQVLINLLGNAVKFTNQGRIVLRLYCENKARRLFFEVEDSGIGIPSEAIEKLFRPFEQVHNEQQAGTGQGTGLGLAISQEIARLMGGEITVSSHVGKGSVFSFSVPYIEGEIQHTERAPRLQRVLGLKTGQPSYRVLIVDDTEDNRTLLIETLSRTGFSARSATSGKEALAVFKTWRPHLILMDMRMPSMDGVEAIQWIRATARGNKVKIMSVTANTFESMRREAFDAGADDFLGKPFREEELFEKIRLLLGVEYDYDLDKHENALPDTSETPDCSPEELASLPSELVEQIRKAAVNADYDLLLGLIQSLEPTNQKLAQGLCSLIENYNYQKLLKILPNRVRNEQDT